MKRRVAWVPLGIFPLGILLSACGQGGPSYLPLVDEKEWSYSVRSNFQDNVFTMKVGNKVSVGGVEGRVMTGGLGEARFAWDKKRLISSMLANTSFIPPVPLLVEDKIPEKKKTRDAEFVPVEEWSGTFESLGKTRKAKATLSQRRSILTLPSGDTNVVETVLKVQIEGAKDDVPLELRTWFERGKGIVRQEQRTNRNLIVGIELIRNN
jgi:hypothetical protein